MKRIVITGSSKGIGFGMASYFLGQGHQVIVVGSSEESTDEAISKLKPKYSDKVFGVACNITNYEEVKNLSEQTIALIGGYDIWINNAGIAQSPCPINELSQEDIKTQIDINIHGVINGSKVAMNYFLEQKTGALYNMEGLGSDGRMAKNLGYYGGTKRFVRYFSRVLAKENEASNVIVGRLSPGMVTTNLLMKDIENSSNKEKTLKIFSILADKVEDVAPFLGQKILSNTKNNVLIAWLTTPKIIFRFMTSSFIKRNPFD